MFIRAGHTITYFNESKLIRKKKAETIKQLSLSFNFLFGLYRGVIKNQNRD